MVSKIESIEWHYLDERAGDGIIKIKLRDLFKPYLLGTSYCTRVVIWWDSQAGEYDESVEVYAIEDMQDDEDFISKAESWYEPDLTDALQWVGENLV